MPDLATVELVGWHQMSEAKYHSDPCPTASLSASCAKTVVSKTLLHAWGEHPHNPDSEKWIPSNVMNVGSAVHAAVFGGAKIFVIDATDSKGQPVKTFQSNAAKEQRDKALSDGLIPILQKDMAAVEQMADICRARFDDLYGGPFHAERVAIWQCPRTGGWRRAMMDSSAKAAPIIVDLKTTQAAIDDEACIRRIFDSGLHIQAAAYEEAMSVLNPEWEGRVQFYFQWQEQSKPFAMSRPIEMGEAAMSIGREQWQAAGALWDAAVKANKFPGYAITPTDASPPPWVLTQWEMKKSMDPIYEGVV